MTERKFTPPTEFPAEYVTADGRKVTLLVRGVGAYPLVGQSEGGVWYYFREDGANFSDHAKWNLHDIPKTKIEWANDYGESFGFWYSSREEVDEKAKATRATRIAVIRREWTEGQPHKYFTEEV